MPTVDPCDGRITADELIEYVRSNVRRYARDRQLSQTPTARGDYEPDMLLGVAQGCLSDGARRRRCSAPPSSNPTWTMSISMSTAR